MSGDEIDESSGPRRSLRPPQPRKSTEIEDSKPKVVRKKGKSEPKVKKLKTESTPALPTVNWVECDLCHKWRIVSDMQNKAFKKVKQVTCSLVNLKCDDADDESVFNTGELVEKRLAELAAMPLPQSAAPKPPKMVQPVVPKPVSTLPGGMHPFSLGMQGMMRPNMPAPPLPGYPPAPLYRPEVPKPPPRTPLPPMPPHMGQGMPTPGSGLGGVVGFNPAGYNSFYPSPPSHFQPPLAPASLPPFYNKQPSPPLPPASSPRPFVAPAPVHQPPPIPVSLPFSLAPKPVATMHAPLPPMQAPPIHVSAALPPKPVSPMGGASASFSLGGNSPQSSRPLPSVGGSERGSMVAGSLGSNGGSPVSGFWSKPAGAASPFAKADGSPKAQSPRNEQH